MEKKMETPGPFKGIYRVILGLYLAYIGVILGLYRDDGKENGNYYNGVIWVLGFRLSEART